MLIYILGQAVSSKYMLTLQFAGFDKCAFSPSKYTVPWTVIASGVYLRL